MSICKQWSWLGGVRVLQGRTGSIFKACFGQSQNLDNLIPNLGGKDAGSKMYLAHIGGGTQDLAHLFE
jgi:hypothetical protein